MSSTYLVEAVRTPRGKGRESGALHGLRPVDLLSQLFTVLQQRSGVAPEEVASVILGCVSQVDDQGGNIAQVAALYSGWNTRGAGLTVNSFCTSSLSACGLADASIRADPEAMHVVGGVECMSRVPLGADRGPVLADREIAAALPFIPNPVIADFIAAAEGFSRSDLDAFAVASHRKAALASEAGWFTRSQVPVVDAGGNTILDKDEAIRPEASAAAMAGLKPLVDLHRARPLLERLREQMPGVGDVEPVHHAGTAPAVVDGASLALLAGPRAVRRMTLPVRARIRACSTARGPAALGLTGGLEAARQALALAGMHAGDIDLWEINEGFAAVVMKMARDLEVPAERLNVNGGGIAMGHAMGATGTNLLGSLVDELERRGLATGLIAISGAIGIGAAVIVERCDQV